MDETIQETETINDSNFRKINNIWTRTLILLVISVAVGLFFMPSSTTESIILKGLLFTPALVAGAVVGWLAFNWRIWLAATLFLCLGTMVIFLTH